MSAVAQLGHSAGSTTLTFYFRAYEDPSPELRGLSVNDQLIRARRLTLEWMETQIEGLADARAAAGGAKLLVWEKQNSVYTANSINGSRYSVWKDGNAWVVKLGDRESSDPKSGKSVKYGLASLADAKRVAERQALKRTRQSLTIQRQRFESQIVHLRALVSAADAAEEKAA